jgi:hypothetical protein
VPRTKTRAAKAEGWTVRRLREYEGPRSLWRVPFAGFLWALPYLLPLAAFIVGAYATPDVEVVLVAGVITVALGALAAMLAQRRPWRSIVSDRLETYLAPNPTAEVPVLVRNQDAERAQLNPDASLRIGRPPDDGPELTRQLRVVEPAAWMESASDEQRIVRIAGILQRAGLRARVAGRDVNATLIGPVGVLVVLQLPSRP